MASSLLTTLSRRDFLRVSGLAAAPLLLGGCMDEPSGPARSGTARLAARPKSPSSSVENGSTAITGPFGQHAVLYVPASIRARSRLLVALHGAGGGADGTIANFSPLADEVGFSLLAMASIGSTWDAIRGGYGGDVRTMDHALSFTFDRLPVSADQVFISGFSDGASYALGVGLSNGDLFSRVVAFSPGFVPALEAAGKPPVFISHGTQDTVLRIDTASRRIVPALRAAGYQVEYEEFEGGHVVLRSIALREFSEAVAGQPA